MPCLTTNPLEAPDLNPYVTGGVTWRRQEFLCAALALPWGQQQHCTLQSTKQINKYIKHCEEIQYSVHGTQEPHARMLEPVWR